MLTVQTYAKECESLDCPVGVTETIKFWTMQQKCKYFVYPKNPMYFKIHIQSVNCKKCLCTILLQIYTFHIMSFYDIFTFVYNR